MKVSIIIPVRNEESLIENIINQLQNKLEDLSYEIIFINDFSTDATKQVIEKTIHSRKQVSLYDNKKKGLGGAITEGINKADGEFVCIMMSD